MLQRFYNLLMGLFDECPTLKEYCVYSLYCIFRNNMYLCITPVSREERQGWYAEHRVHAKHIIRPQENVVILGDSILAGLARYPSVWDDHLRPLNAINCGIRDDLTQNVLWRAGHLSLPDSVRVAVILCCTNDGT